jgi:serine protease Do
MRVGFIRVFAAAVALAASCAFAQNTRAVGPVTIQRAGTSYLGVGVLDVTPERAKTLNLKEERGAEVTHVDEDSPAAKAGIKEGDVLLQYNGEPVEGTEQLSRMVRETPVGRQAKLTVWRNGANQNVTATIAARKNTILQTGDGSVVLPNLSPTPPMPPMPSIELPRFQMSWQNPMLGIEGESLGQEPQLADFFGVKDGVLVKTVIKSSAAEKAGMKAGDIITKVDDSKVASTREITSALRANRSKRTFTVTVVRNKKEMPVTVTLEDRGGNAAPPAEKF